MTRHSGVSVSPSPIQGNGVFASQAFRRGSVLLHLDDSRVVDLEHPLRTEAVELECHRDFLSDGTVVLMQVPERYINHSCDPNCYVYSVHRERFLLARRDIAAGEEISMDYALNAIDGDVWDCRCNSENCRGLHKCDFFCLPLEVQLENLPYLDPWFASVHAPRIELMLKAGERRVTDI